jgi:hypothetical protein
MGRFVYSQVTACRGRHQRAPHELHNNRLCEGQVDSSAIEVMSMTTGWLHPICTGAGFLRFSSRISAT